ncbi:acetyl esterase/lipase [Kineococcus radiotolerans]|uniref:Acetyl esterase/lipase n=1 Tax=Kineococcus radiotolerans TaxID=131568 RepID=A0A7W4TR68_KINRA|nr:alpha/beta hydrolase [Kineococcus radiotolerans]MBB2903599.1 acetyl esterase/lipase [Kineococcus radiotolerans]
MSEIEIVLEPAAQAFVDANKTPPFLFQLTPQQGRDIATTLQSGYPDLLPVDQEDLEIPGGPTGSVSVRITRPVGATGPLPVIVYTHGLGWVYGGKDTHDRLVREIAVGTGAAVVFTDYSLAPEAKYPIAIEQIFTVAQWVTKFGAEHDLDTTRIAAAGDSVGGNMTAVLALMAKERGGIPLLAQVMFYPVTDATFETPSSHEFAEGYFLYREGMQWFWDQYTTDPAQRAEPYASPLKASLEQLTGLPPALIIVGQADVLRDEGEAYANKLRRAGVPVTATRYQGIIHDFVGLNPLRATKAAEGAINQAIDFLRRALSTSTS